MNFSDSIPQSSGIVEYSPNGNLVAIAKAFEVKVFETANLRPLHTFSFADLVSHLEWSPDCNLILVGIAKRGMAFVKSVHDPEWNCKIDEGMAGLAYCRWAPTSRHVISVSDFKLRMTVWSLADKSV